MPRTALAAVLLVLACAPPRWCDRINGTLKRLSPSGSCAEGNRSLTLAGTTCRETDVCSSDDELALTDYVRCINLQQPCSQGNERVTLDGADRCSATFRSALSPACLAAIE